jgi:glycosyl transferase family 87
MTAFLAELGLLGVAPLLFGLAEYFGWGAGAYRCCTLLVLFAWVAWITRGKLRLDSVFTRGRLRFVLILGAVVLVFVHVRTVVIDIKHSVPCMTDMGRPSICAGEWWLAGLNPWAECAPRKLVKHRPRTEPFSWCIDTGGDCIDPKYGGTYTRWQHHGSGYDFMDGYKYGPLLVFAYLPFTHRWLERGLYVVNLAFFLALLACCFALARMAYPRIEHVSCRTLCALLLPAALPFRWLMPFREIEALGRRYELYSPDPMMVVRQLTLGCSNDVIAIVFALGAILFAARGRSLAAGAMCGLSLASKQLPGVLIVLLLLQLEGVSWRRLLAGAALTAGAFYLPFFLAAPREMFANLVLFGLFRPTNSSSIRRFLPPGLEPFVSLVQIGVVAWFAYRLRRSDTRDVPALLRATTLALIGFVALNKVVHGNYFMWLEPFVAILVAGAPFASSGEPALASRGGRP